MIRPYSTEHAIMAFIEDNGYLPTSLLKTSTLRKWSRSLISKDLALLSKGNLTLTSKGETIAERLSTIPLSPKTVRDRLRGALYYSLLSGGTSYAYYSFLAKNKLCDRQDYRSLTFIRFNVTDRGLIFAGLLSRKYKERVMYSIPSILSIEELVNYLLDERKAVRSAAKRRLKESFPSPAQIKEVAEHFNLEV